MISINFKFKKNNNILINKNNIKCIFQNNKLSFIDDCIKYSYFNKVFIKENEEELICLDFNFEKCKIHLKKQGFILNLKIKLKHYSINNNKLKIIYTIETEEDIENTIIIEKNKSS